MQVKPPKEDGTAIVGSRTMGCSSILLDRRVLWADLPEQPAVHLPFELNQGSLLPLSPSPCNNQ